MNGRNDHDDVDVASEHGTEEKSDHDKSPDGPGDESLLLLLILGLSRRFLGLGWSVS